MKSTEFGQARVAFATSGRTVLHAVDDGRMVRSVALGRPSAPMSNAASVAPRQTTPHEPESVGVAAGDRLTWRHPAPWVALPLHAPNRNVALHKIAVALIASY